jgi:HK97 family phage major capsid protein
MTKHYRLETKSATELPADDNVTEIKSALDNLVKDVGEKTKPIADLEKRLAAVEAKAARPNISRAESKDEAKELEAKALNSLLRNGAASLDDAEKKTLSIGTGTGGYVQAPEFSTVVVDKITQLSPMRQVANVMNVGSSKVYIPVGLQGIAPIWISETGARTTTEPTFDQIELDIYEQSVVVPISSALLEDSFIDLQSYIANQAAVQFAKAEASAFMVGDSTGKPTGLLKTPANYAQVTADQDGSDILDAVIAAFYKLPGAYAANASWFMSRTTQGAIRAAADNATKGTLWSDSLADGTPARLLGRPVFDAPDMDDVASGDSPAGNTFPIALFDGRAAYQIADRISTQVLRDDYTGSANGTVNFRLRRRVGGVPLLTEAVVLVKATP